MYTIQPCTFMTDKIDQNNNFDRLPSAEELEIDHVIQQPKETFQTTCRGP